MDLVPNGLKKIPRTETTQKSLLKTFRHDSKGTRKIKDLKKLSNKDIYFTLQSNNTKYIKPFKFISWPNFIEGKHSPS